MGTSIYGLQLPQRKMWAICLKKTGLGTPALDGDCKNFATITDNGVGDYTITLKSGVVFAKIPEALIQVKDAGFAIPTAVSKSAITIETFDVDGSTPAEIDFDLLLIGTLASDYQG